MDNLDYIYSTILLFFMALELWHDSTRHESKLADQFIRKAKRIKFFGLFCAMVFLGFIIGWFPSVVYFVVRLLFFHLLYWLIVDRKKLTFKFWYENLEIFKQIKDLTR